MSKALQIAVIAKYPFYFEDIRSKLENLKCKISYFENLKSFQSSDTNSINLKYDFLFFPHVSEIIPRELLLKFNCIGFHTGDLPNDRGGTPIQNKILKGEYKTKVSAFLLNEQIDGGPIYCSRIIDLEFGNIAQILQRISAKIADLVYEIIVDMKIPNPQIGFGATNKRISSTFSHLELLNLSVKQIYDRIRMVDGLDYPRAYLIINGFKITLQNAEIHNDKLNFHGIIERIH